jgi:Ankyrin repeats (3 copies)
MLLQHPNIQVNLGYVTTPLHITCYLFNLNKKCHIILQELLGHSQINVMVKDCAGETPLIQACKYGACSLRVDILLKHQPKRYRRMQLNAACDWSKTTPLHAACGWDRTGDMVRLLLNHVTELNINALDNNGNTPLHLLCGRQPTQCSSQTVEILRHMLKQPSIMIYQGNHQAQTPLDRIHARLSSINKNEDGQTYIEIQRAHNVYREMVKLLKQYFYQQRFNVFRFLMNLTFSKRK